MKISFVVPVYNVEKYLPECIDSILCQMTEECEIILVDDGATDASGSICDKYAESNSNINVIHKQNGGLSSARNAGMDEAKGFYISFIDADDRLSPNCVADILKNLNTNDADICFMQTKKFYADGTEEDLGDSIYERDIYGKNINEIMCFLRTRPKYPGSAANKIFRREFLQKKGLRFPDDSRYSEDLGFIRDCLLKAEKIKAIDVPYYEYRQNREGSITAEFSEKKYFDIFLFIKETADMVSLNKLRLTEREKTVLSFAAYEYAICLWKLSHITKQKRFNVYKFLKKYKWVMRYGEAKRLRIIYFMLKIFGLKLSSWIIGLYKRYEYSNIVR